MDRDGLKKTEKQGFEQTHMQLWIAVDEGLRDS